MGVARALLLCSTEQRSRCNFNFSREQQLFGDNAHARSHLSESDCGGCASQSSVPNVYVRRRRRSARPYARQSNFNVHRPSCACPPNFNFDTGRALRRPRVLYRDAERAGVFGPPGPR